MNYYLSNLFDSPRSAEAVFKAPRLTVYKRELYDYAECINLCLLLRGRFPQLKNTLETVVDSNCEILDQARRFLPLSPAVSGLGQCPCTDGDRRRCFEA